MDAMNTPIADFVKKYEKKNMSRFHMPGHKGQTFLGCENYDITEVAGADALYEADGIIAESEKNAAKLFGTGRTLYSTEGSSQCIRAMLYLAVYEWKRKYGKNAHSKPVIVAARNVHKAFVYAAALLDFEVIWLWPTGSTNSICSCLISADTLEDVLVGLENPPAAVYVTSPDYLGNQQDIAAFANICHKYNTVLAVDNAHGAYLHFIKPKMHPIDLGADICCDSAHKTLPVLTGGAYLQISKTAPESFAQNAKHALALFGSTSPSYLILISLDLCNRYLSDGYTEKLKNLSDSIEIFREKLQDKNWKTEGTENLKLTIRMPKSVSGIDMAQNLRKHQIECEFADPEYLVLMLTPENTEEDFLRIEKAFDQNVHEYEETNLQPAICQRKMSIRDAVFGTHEEISVDEAMGRICGTVTVSCPPAIPIVVSGEVIDENAIHLFHHYGIEKVDVIIEDN